MYVVARQQSTDEAHVSADSGEARIIPCIQLKDGRGPAAGLPGPPPAGQWAPAHLL